MRALRTCIPVAIRDGCYAYDSLSYSQNNFFSVMFFSLQLAGPNLLPALSYRSAKLKKLLYDTYVTSPDTNYRILNGYVMRK